MNTAYISLSRINANYSLLSKDKNLIAVVKADAYGHGLLPTARALYGGGARFFAVADGEEALTLSRTFRDADVLLFGFPDESYILPLLSHNVIFTVSDRRGAVLLSRLAAESGRTARVHIALNSGMNRMGFSLSPDDRDMSLYTIQRLSKLPHFAIEGIYSHLATAPQDPLYAVQYERFFSAVRELIRFLPAPAVHIFATPALASAPPRDLLLPRFYYRAGLSLYGYGHKDVRPAMTVTGRIIGSFVLRKGEKVGYGGDYRAVRDTHIAVVGIGYADGLPRCAPGAFFSARGERFPLIGRVSMNQSTIDCGHTPPTVGDSVTVIGANGEETAAMCAASGCIPYELLMIGNRVKRIYTS